MRLWHKDLIPVLPRQQLLGQWRECVLIAKQIAEKGTPNHLLVNKVVEYPENMFNSYTNYVYLEMTRRGYRADWHLFQKHRCRADEILDCSVEQKMIFPVWHNDRYMAQCLANLQEKADCGAIPAKEWKRITDRWPEYK